MANLKFIRDPLYGNIEVKDVILELTETPEVQRLLAIKQLGYTYLVYPGAHHTRFEHSLGTCFVAQKMCKALEIQDIHITVSALLHDIGHGPYSHTLEYLQYTRTKKDHVDYAKEMISGKKGLTDSHVKETIPEIIKRHDISAKEIIKILNGENTIKADIIHGPLDADQLDFLMRDALYTGVAYGVIDIDRIMQTMKTVKNKIVFEKKGLSSLESMLVARALMYSAVYLHKTVRIAELMLSRAVERAPVFDFSFMTDCELLSKLNQIGGYPKDIVTRLKFRRLFKKAFSKTRANLDNDKKKLSVGAQDEIVEIENEIAKKAGLDEGYVIIDCPGKDILLSEPRLKKMDVNIIDNDEVYPLHELTPLIYALQNREITEWAVMVCCPEKHIDKVAEISKKMLIE